MKKTTALTALTLTTLALTGLLVDDNTPTPQSSPSKKVHILGQPDPWRWYQWSLEKANINITYQNPQKIKIAIIDTGIAQHEDLPEINYLAGKNYINPDKQASDDNGHGTHVAGIIAAITNNQKGISGAANNIELIPIKVLDQYGYGDTGNVAKGIIWATDQGADIINLSLGSDEPDPALQAAIEYATSKNVIVVAAAGNTKNQKSWPGAYPQPITVGACDENLAGAVWSANFDYVDVCGPGVNIISTTKTSNYTIMSGTSMATPYVSALAALLRGGGENPETIAAKIQTHTTPAGKTKAAGSGMINYRKTLNDNTTNPPEETTPTLPELPKLPDLPKLPTPKLPDQPDKNTPKMPVIGQKPAIIKLAVLQQKIKQKTYITALTYGTDLNWTWTKTERKNKKIISHKTNQIVLKTNKKTYKITLKIKNSHGTATKTIKIKP